MAITPHDVWRQKASQNVAYNAAGGASVQSAAFGSQTYAIRVVVVGVVDSTNNGARIAVGDNPTASATSTMLPNNFVEYIKCSPGQKVAALSNTAVTGSLNVTELTD
jgi:hypothetical protein